MCETSQIQNTDHVNLKHTCYQNYNSGNDFNSYIKVHSDVVRVPLNAAVYIETPVCKMGPFRTKVVTTKHCTCLTQEKNCPCHPKQMKNNNDNTSSSIVSLEQDCIKKTPAFSREQHNKQSGKSNSHTQTICKNPVKEALKPPTECISPDEIKTSLTSLSTIKTTSTIHFVKKNATSKEDAFKNWVLKKAKEKKRLEDIRWHAEELKKQERESYLSKERENFVRWLACKKKEDEKRRTVEEKKLRKEKKKKECKERRSEENELHYQLWLKKKEQAELEKKIKTQIQLLKTAEKDNSRYDRNAKAYQEWFVKSKDTPRPLPLNQGLTSLRSSVSVTYINPTPWISNMEQQMKPIAQ